MSIGTPAPHPQSELWAAISHHLKDHGAALLGNPNHFAPAERGLIIALRLLVPFLETGKVGANPLLLIAAHRYILTKSLYAEDTDPPNQREIVT